MSKKTETKRSKPLGIRVDDTVVVIAGKNKGSEPRKVIAVDRAKGRVTVEGVNVMKDRERNASQGRGGQTEVVEKAFPIDRSNVMLLDPQTKKPTRAKIEVRDGKRVRVGIKSGEVI
jgi:large subunit ribosomal protein L24